MSVAVLGCGPAGLLAAHAARRMGHEVVIYSVKTKSVIRGAQYLHKYIDDEITPSQDCRWLIYQYVGYKAHYASKIYGDPEAECSWGVYPTEAKYWCMHGVYDSLWDMYQGIVVDKAVTPDFVDTLRMSGNWDLVVSSIPLVRIARSPGDYKWRFEYVWIVQDDEAADDGVIVYNGDPNVLWYRASNLCGYGFREYPFRGMLNAGDIAGTMVKKPLSTDYPEESGVLRVGRYGKWDKNQLAHDAYYDVRRALGDAVL